jgi:hypothetical protein
VIRPLVDHFAAQDARAQDVDVDPIVAKRLLIGLQTGRRFIHNAFGFIPGGVCDLGFDAACRLPTGISGRAPPQSSQPLNYLMPQT